MNNKCRSVAENFSPSLFNGHLMQLTKTTLPLFKGSRCNTSLDCILLMKWLNKSYSHLPLNVISHLPALHSLIVLSADPVNMKPCSGIIPTAHTAASCPAQWKKQNII